MEQVSRAEIEACMRWLGIDEMQARWHVQQRRALAAMEEDRRRRAADECRRRYEEAVRPAPACKTCPWRTDGHEYDEDGREAFMDGYDASCHALVGLQRVFHNQPALPGQECRGPENFDAGVPGYRNAIEPR